jgi:hypothetical protein
MKKPILILFSAFLFGQSYAQKCLSNEDIYAMCKDSVSSEVIITKIKYTECCFNLASSDLIEISKNKVPDVVINEMIAAMGSHKRAGVRGRNPRVPRSFSKRSS